MNFAPVAGAVIAGTYGNITITAQESTAFNAIITVATDLLTSRYKTKKIKEIIVKYNDTIRTPLTLLNQSLI